MLAGLDWAGPPENVGSLGANNVGGYYKASQKEPRQLECEVLLAGSQDVSLMIDSTDNHYSDQKVMISVVLTGHFGRACAREK